MASIFLNLELRTVFSVNHNMHRQNRFDPKMESEIPKIILSKRQQKTVSVPAVLSIFDKGKWP